MSTSDRAGAAPGEGSPAHELENGGLRCLPTAIVNSGSTVNQSSYLTFHCAAGFSFGARFLDFPIWAAQAGSGIGLDTHNQAHIRHKGRGWHNTRSIGLCLSTQGSQPRPIEGTVIKTRAPKKTNKLTSLTIRILSPFTWYNPANAINCRNAGIRMPVRLGRASRQGTETSTNVDDYCNSK